MKRFSFFAFILLTAFYAYGEDRLGSLHTSPMLPIVDSETLSEWKKDVFGIGEVWVLTDPEGFYNSLLGAKIAPELLKELKNSRRVELTSTERANLITFYSPEDAKEILILSAELKARLPYAVLAAAYRSLYQTGRLPPFRKFESFRHLNAFFIRSEFSNDQIEKVKNSIFKIEREVYFIYSPEIWPDLNEKMKIALIHKYTRDTAQRRGLHIELTYGATDNLSEIAERYAGGRDPKKIEEFLRNQLERSRNKTVTVPLSSILHPVIQDRIDTHTPCSGPNCFNSSLSVNEGSDYKLVFTRADDLALFDELYRKYRFVLPAEALQTGDVLLYLGENGKPVHASTYIAENIVFTKNGASRFNPYIFQTFETNLSVYFPNGNYKIMVFRRPKVNESPVSPRGYNFFFGEEVYFRKQQAAPPEVQLCRELFT